MCSQFVRKTTTAANIIIIIIQTRSQAVARLADRTASQQTI